MKLAWFDAQGKFVFENKLPDDIRTWLPGEFELKASVAVPKRTGVYHLALGVIDPWTKKPAIRFANQMFIRNGWIILGNVGVNSERN